MGCPLTKTALIKLAISGTELEQKISKTCMRMDMMQWWKQV
jgi:hypothetical protein